MGQQIFNVNNVQYQYIETLNTTVLGKVFLVQDSSGCRYVLKVVSNDGLNIKELNLIRHHNIDAEVEVLKRFASDPHANIQQMVDHERTDTNTRILSVFYPNGELFDSITNDVGLTMQLDIKSCCKQMLCAVDALHKAHFAHRDISPENIMLDAENNCVLIDFGLATHVPTTNMLPAEGQFGKTPFCPPEIVDGTIEYDPYKVDIWALGILFCMLSTGLPPFNIAHESDECFQAYKVVGLAPMYKHWEKDLDSSLLDLISNMLCISFESRYTIDDVLQHEWLRGHI